MMPDTESRQDIINLSAEFEILLAERLRLYASDTDLARPDKDALIMKDAFHADWQPPQAPTPHNLGKHNLFHSK